MSRLGCNSEKCILWLKVCTRKAVCLQALMAELLLSAHTPQPFAAKAAGNHFTFWRDRTNPVHITALPASSGVNAAMAQPEPPSGQEQNHGSGCRNYSIACWQNCTEAEQSNTDLMSRLLSKRAYC